MGSGRFSSADWDAFTRRATAGKSREEVFAGHLHDALDPAKAKGGVRESRDSADNPASTPIILGLDVTGSMGDIPDYMVRHGLPAFFDSIYARKPVSDPHVMFMGIGDVEYDAAPLQVSQFEADIRIAEQLKSLYLEGGGGGNTCESYTLPWYYAARHTVSDAFEKRQKKGYLFTVGDECAPPKLLASEIKRVLGVNGQADYTAAQLLDLVSRRYHVFHLMVEEGNYFRSASKDVTRSWRALLGQRALLLRDYTKLAEVVVAAIQVTEGASADAVAASWGGDTAVAVRHATGALTAGSAASASKWKGLRWFGGRG